MQEDHRNIGVVCGSNLPEPLTTEANILHLVFVSDLLKTGKGFKVVYYETKGMLYYMKENSLMQYVAIIQVISISQTLQCYYDGRNGCHYMLIFLKCFRKRNNLNSSCYFHSINVQFLHFLHLYRPIE